MSVSAPPCVTQSSVPAGFHPGFGCGFGVFFFQNWISSPGRYENASSLRSTYVGLGAAPAKGETERPEIHRLAATRGERNAECLGSLEGFPSYRGRAAPDGRVVLSAHVLSPLNHLTPNSCVNDLNLASSKLLLHWRWFLRGFPLNSKRWLNTKSQIVPVPWNFSAFWIF